MLSLPKQICSEKFEYYSDLSVDNLKDEIKKMLDKAWGLSFSTNMTGNFFSESEFQITPKWSFVANLSSLIKIRTGTRLLGTIFKNENNITQVNLTVIPDSLFSTFFIFIPILMIAIMIVSIQKGLLDFPSLSILICFIIILPFVILGIIKLSKLALLQRFVTYFNLGIID